MNQKASAIELTDPTQPPSKLVKEALAKKAPTPTSPVPSTTQNNGSSTVSSPTGQNTTFDPASTTIRVIYTANNSKVKNKSKHKIIYKNNSKNNFIVMEEKILKVGKSINDMKIIKISDTQVLLREGSDKNADNKAQKPIIHTISTTPHVAKNAKYYGKPVDVIVSTARPLKLALNNPNNAQQATVSNKLPTANPSTPPTQQQVSAEVANKVANLPINNKPEDNYKNIVGGLQK